MPVMPKHSRGFDPAPAPAPRKLTAAEVRANKMHMAKTAKPVAKVADPAPKSKAPIAPPPLETPVGFKLPKTLAGCADLLYTHRQARLAKQKEVDAAQKIETFLTEYLIANLPKSDALGVTGKMATATIVPKEIFQVDDWDAFYAHVAKKKAFFLLNKALSTAAVKEIWAAGQRVPGVAKHDRKVISLTKRPGA